MNLPRILLALLCLTGLTASAQVTLTPSYTSAYVFRGQRLGGAAFQPTVELDKGNVAIGVWASTPLADKVPGVSDPEVDPYATYTYTVNDMLSLIPGVTVYTYPHADAKTGSYSYTVEPNLALTYKRWGFAFTPKAYYDTVLHSFTGELSVGYALPVPTLGSELDFTGQYGEYRTLDTSRDSLPRTKTWGNYYLVGVSLPYQVGKTKVAIGYAYTGFHDAYSKDGSEPRDGESPSGWGVVSASLSWTF